MPYWHNWVIMSACVWIYIFISCLFSYANMPSRLLQAPRHQHTSYWPTSVDNDTVWPLLIVNLFQNTDNRHYRRMRYAGNFVSSKCIHCSNPVFSIHNHYTVCNIVSCWTVLQPDSRLWCISWDPRNRAHHPGGHYWDYYPGTLCYSQVAGTHLKIRHAMIYNGAAVTWQCARKVVPAIATSGPFYWHGSTFNLSMDKEAHAW